MYSDKQVAKKVADEFNRSGTSLIQYDDGQLEDMTNHLTSLVAKFDKDGRPEGGLAGLKRPLTQSEIAYVRNERLLCQIDFRYFATRYCNIKLAAKAGEVVKFGRMREFMLTQEVLLSKLAAAEERMMFEYEAGQPVPGIWFLIHKARQTGFTAIGRMLMMHRSAFFPDTTCLSASINDEMVQELYDRDQIIYQHLPWFLKPAVQYNTKAAQFSFEDINSGILYHQSNQKAGLGTGRTISNVHLTECALWESAGGAPDKIEFSLLPGVPRAVNTLVVLESTAEAAGGYWYNAVTACLKGRDKLFNLLFCPWYAADHKYVATPPPGWDPMELTKAMIATAERTSPAYLQGTQVRLTREQAFYWEDQFMFHKGRRMLSQFYRNYPTTIDESFVSDASAFSVETIADLRAGVGQLIGAYDLA